MRTCVYRGTAAQLSLGFFAFKVKKAISICSSHERLAEWLESLPKGVGSIPLPGIFFYFVIIVSSRFFLIFYDCLVPFLWAYGHIKDQEITGKAASQSRRHVSFPRTNAMKFPRLHPRAHWESLFIARPVVASGEFHGISLRKRDMPSALGSRLTSNFLVFDVTEGSQKGTKQS